MLRTVCLALVLTVSVSLSAVAGPIGPYDQPTPYGPVYSASSSPFESFNWTPLDFAAFQAYGGDFANVRKPVAQFHFFESPVPPPGAPGPDDELGFARLRNVPFFEEVPDDLGFSAQALVQTESVPEPGTLLLVGLGLLGASTRLRRAYRAR